jgi:tetratricopeptide (TPR) repeat protein
MADLRPDSQALVRIAHVRFLRGDLDGALLAARDATRAVSARDAETSAWMSTRLALYEFQSGHADTAQAACAAALKVHTDYPPALLLQGRMLLAATNGAQAIEPIRNAARLNPLPEYQWALSEALRATGQLEMAARTEAYLQRTGPAEDPRTFSLFLATRHLSPALALELAERELGQRADVHTHDALAWALAANERWDDAAAQIAMALAEGTVDARFLLHATAIATHRARLDEAREFAAKTSRVQHMLLPSERETFEKLGRLLRDASNVQERRPAADKLEAKL